MVRIGLPDRIGFNDGVVLPPSRLAPGASPRAIRSAALNRSPLHGTLRVAVILSEFSDRQFDAGHDKAHFEQLFFSLGQIATGSVREYFREVTSGLVDITGEVVGPLTLPRSLDSYANGESGMGWAKPNAQTMARDAALAADQYLQFASYDNDHDGYVDAFVVVHAGGGAEETGNPDDIWSHKWVLDGGELPIDSTRIYAYLTVPEDSRIGVCCHELGHLIFGFPDLYDADGSSNGVGDWCLMGGGSWGGGGLRPVHPSAWCKANQGWAHVENVTVSGRISIPDVKTSRKVFRLWNNGGVNREYFLLENRQKSDFDAELPGNGLLIWHIDESVADNTNEARYMVALEQADGERTLEKPPLTGNRGDAGDPYPGSKNNRSFGPTTAPDSRAYNGQATGVSVTDISDSGSEMTAQVAVGDASPAQPRPSAVTLPEIVSRLEALERVILPVGTTASSLSTGIASPNSPLLRRLAGRE
jgi:immune inhibitor A